MRDVIVALGLGAASGVLGVVAYRFRFAWLGWLTLAPLATAVYLYAPLPAGLAGGVCGALLAASNRQMSRPAASRGARRVEALFVVAVALLWAGVFAPAAWLWPNGVPAWGALIMPAAAVAVSLYHRVGAPRVSQLVPGHPGPGPARGPHRPGRHRPGHPRAPGPVRGGPGDPARPAPALGCRSRCGGRLRTAPAGRGGLRLPGHLRPPPRARLPRRGCHDHPLPAAHRHRDRPQRPS